MRLLSSLCVLVLSIPTVIVSISMIRTKVAAADVVALARQIEALTVVPEVIVAKALDDVRESTIALSCEDEVSGAMASLAVYLLNRNLSEGGEPKDKARLEHQALSAIERRISCSPTDGNAWLMRAEVLQQLNPNSAEVAVSMLRSYRLAKAESWIMGPRFEFAVRHFDFVQQNLMPEFVEDLRVMTVYAPPDVVAKNYVIANPKVREMIAEILAGLPKDKSDAVSANAERLGVILRGRWACGDGQKMGSGLGRALWSDPAPNGACKQP